MKAEVEMIPPECLHDVALHLPDVDTLRLTAVRAGVQMTAMPHAGELDRVRRMVIGLVVEHNRELQFVVCTLAVVEDDRGSIIISMVKLRCAQFTLTVVQGHDVWGLLVNSEQRRVRRLLRDGSRKYLTPIRLEVFDLMKRVDSQAKVKKLFFLIEMPSEDQPPDTLTVDERKAGILLWSLPSKPCGLEKLKEMLNRLLNE
jgi:hypothetical protein